MPIQDNWRWCNKCQALTFAGAANLGPCPATGEHDHKGSSDYGLVEDDVAAFGQDNWRWCNKCQAMAFAGGSSPGSCSAGGTHDHSGSGNYLVTQKQDGQPGQDNWRWCRKCQVLASAGGTTPGACAAGGVHDHTGSGDYVLPEVSDCHPLALSQQIDDLDQKIQSIQNAPGFIQGPQGPNPGKPDPIKLNQVKELETKLGAVQVQYDSCTGAQHNAVFDVVCDGTQCVSINKVYANIAAQLNGKVVGYACSVGRTLTYGSWGYARTQADSPSQPFHSYTKMATGSIGKVVTALAAIRVLAKHVIPLDWPIGGYFPKSWSVDPNVAAITFRQLLSQKSGIKDYGPQSDMQKYDNLKKFFTQSVDPTQPINCQGPTVINPPNPINPNDHCYCYSNYNFSIFRILLPSIEGYPDDADQLAAGYVKAAQTYVFEPVGRFGVDCKPPSGSQDYAFAYQFPGSSSGTDFGDSTSIAGGGGWYLSVEDIAAVMASLNKDDGRILTSAQLTDMVSPIFDPNCNDFRGLGWDSLILGNNYRYVEKNGSWGSNGNVISTSIALFGPGIVGVLFMNSDIAGAPGVIASTVLLNAYTSALTPQK